MEKENEKFVQVNYAINALVQVNAVLFTTLYSALPEIRDSLRNILKSPPPAQQENDYYYREMVDIIRGSIESFEEAVRDSSPNWFQGLIIGGGDKLSESPEEEGE